MTHPETRETRRDFLRLSGRCFGFGGLAALVIAGETKRRKLAGDPNCIKLFTCADCAEFSGCNLPKAETFRTTAKT